MMCSQFDPAALRRVECPGTLAPRSVPRAPPLTAMVKILVVSETDAE